MSENIIGVGEWVGRLRRGGCSVRVERNCRMCRRWNPPLLLHPIANPHQPFLEESYGARSLVFCGPNWDIAVPATSPTPEEYHFMLRREDCVWEREAEREVLYVCKRECDRESWNKSFLSSCTSFVNLLFFCLHSAIHRVWILPPRIVITSSFPLPLFTSQYVLPVRADYKSNPKFVLPPFQTAKP